MVRIEIKHSAKILKKLLDTIATHPFYVKDEYTKCNYAVNEAVRTYCSYDGFVGLQANDIIEKMEMDKAVWQRLYGHGLAQGEANRGEMVVAGLEGRKHGHVVVIYPGKMVFSGKWERWVPLCMNVGKSNWVGRGINYAFRKEPKYFLYMEECK